MLDVMLSGDSGIDKIVDTQHGHRVKSKPTMEEIRHNALESYLEYSQVWHNA